MIVSERGRHSDESRRIVRAQAARASAAQSRVTRARNREGRDGTGREGPQSPILEGQSQSVETPSIDEAAAATLPLDAKQLTEKPLIGWLMSSQDVSTSSLLENVQSLPSAVDATLTGLVSPMSAARGIGVAFGSVASFGQAIVDSSRPQLPLAVPRGFATLQQRIQISDDLIILLSRSACFDFGSPGVEERLHKLLFDLIISHARALFSPISLPGHPIQGHLRIACTCLTIFQGQRADGPVLAAERKYHTGLEAAWSEAMLLDQSVLTEQKSAEASLWAVFIISVTTGSTASFFHQLLHGLFQDLNLRYWSQVRNILLEFIYPVSFLDAPCKSFFENLQQLQIGVT